MTDYFFDSSALVKRYILEVGTNWVRSIVDPNSGNEIIVAQITEVEVMSAVSRLARETLITAQVAHSIQMLLRQEMVREYVVIKLTKSISQNALSLLSRYPLRAYDAVQLASALQITQRLRLGGLSGLTFVSADQRLLSVAASEGLSTDNPTHHP